MAKSDYKNSLNQLGDRLRSEPPKTPIQEVRPVEQNAGAAPALEPLPQPEPAQPRSEAHVNFWVSQELMDRLKLHALKSRKTIRQVATEALEEYLNKP